MFPTGFSNSSMTMGFMWMPVEASRIYVVHYMDHNSGSTMNEGGFGNNWLTFTVCYVRTDSPYYSVIKLDKYNGFESEDKTVSLPYFVGITQFHHKMESSFNARESSGRDQLLLEAY